MRAFLNNYRQSPRKVRVVANMIRGRRVADALATLDFAGKRAAAPLKKLVQSAAANAVANSKADRETLFVKEVQVNKAATLKRWQPASHGSAHRINKRMSHVSIILGAVAPTAPAAKTRKPAVPKAPRKTAKKATH